MEDESLNVLADQMLDQTTRDQAAPAYHPAWRTVMEAIDEHIAQYSSIEALADLSQVSADEVKIRVESQKLYIGFIKQFRERILNAVAAVQEQDRAAAVKPS
jgi:DNA-binding SARP family transcriptional activator